MSKIDLVVLVGSVVLAVCSLKAFAQGVSTGNPGDFKIKTCLHSVSYAGFWRGQARLTVDEFLVKAKELGYDGVMLMAKRPHVSPLDYDAEARRKLKQKIDSLGLKLVCLAGYTDFTAGSDKAGVPHVEIQAMYVGQVAQLARDLGTDVVRVFTGYRRPGIAFDKQYATVLQGLKLAGKEAAKYGVTLAVQNHHDIALHHDVMYWLLKEVDMPNVKAAFDAWSPTLEGLSNEQIRDAVLKMKPYTIHTTVAQYVRFPQYSYQIPLTTYQKDQDVIRAVPMGKGIIDYDNFITALKETGYQGYIAYEMCEVLEGGGEIENLDRTAKKFLEYIDKFR